MNNDFILGWEAGGNCIFIGENLPSGRFFFCFLCFFSGRLMGHHIYFFFFSRYASLYFCCAVESQDNELLTLEIVHRYVELLDKYFGNVSCSGLVESVGLHLSSYFSLSSITFLLSLKCKI